MYDCLSENDGEDKEMEPAPSEAPTGPNCPIIQEIVRKMCNDKKKEQNENRKSARKERRKRRQRRQAMKEVDEVKEETKAALKDCRAAAKKRRATKSNERTTQQRRLPRLNPVGTDQQHTAGRAYEAMNLRANMHSARARTNIEQEQPR